MIRITINDGSARVINASRSEAVLGFAPDVPAPGDIPLAGSGLVEARGALLCWDVTAGERYPHALIHAPDEAAGWLWELYGDRVADAVLAATDAGPWSEASEESIAPEHTGPRDQLWQLASLSWAEAWWPASRRAGIPALSRVLLAADTALATAAAEHLLEDENAVERALSAVGTMLAGLRSVRAWPAFTTEADQIAESLRNLAEDRGFAETGDGEATNETSARPGTGPPAEPPRGPGSRSDDPNDWALAAGGEHVSSQLALASGSAPTAWSGLGPQTLDAAAEAEWSILRRDGRNRLAVTVPAAPEVRYPIPETPPAPVLAARFGPADLGVRLSLRRNGNTFGGETELPPNALLLPTAERTLSITDPRLDEGDEMEPEPEVRAALLDYARARLTEPSASLAERFAGRDGGRR